MNAHGCYNHYQRHEKVDEFGKLTVGIVNVICIHSVTIPVERTPITYVRIRRY